MTPKQIHDLVHARAERTETGTAYWINDEEEGDDGDDYCRDCITALPALPGLVFCHLLALVGDDVLAPQPHEWGEPQYGHRGCEICPEGAKEGDEGEADPCWSWPKRIVERARAARDGGWDTERDSWVTCEGCGMDLDFIPTDYFADSELEHWEAHGPPESGRGWWEISVLLDGLLNYYIEDAAEKDQRWAAVSALMEKWGIRAESAEQGATPPEGHSGGAAEVAHCGAWREGEPGPCQNILPCATHPNPGHPAWAP